MYKRQNQDIALVVDKHVPAEAVRRTIEEAAGELLESVALFDVYESDQLGVDKKSLAFAMVFRAGDKTLTEDEASEARMRAAKAAEAEHGAAVRGI